MTLPRTSMTERRTRSQGGKGRHWRAEFTLTVPKGCDLVDLFHNGKDGYRARYLRSRHEGDRANEFLMNLLRPKLANNWRKWARRRFKVEWLNKSIGKGAKVWVRQGQWSRGKKRHRISIQLSVDRWLAHQSCGDACVRKKVKLGALCPREFEIDVKGVFLSRKGAAMKQPKPKEQRARQIHLYGFT
jgi:hypothetical protein